MSEANDKLEAALKYAARGWCVFPLKPDSKTPATPHGVKDATRDPNIIRDWWTKTPSANVGIACGVGDCGPYVVDVDAPNGTHKHDGAASLAGAGITLPPTLTATTASGGKHLYFAILHTPPTDKLNNCKNVNGLMGVDVRTAGGYVVAPPSIIDGVPYRWDNYEKVPCLTDYPTKLYRKPQERKTDPIREHPETPAPVHADQRAAVERARAYLLEMPPAIQGNAGHDALLRAAQAMAVGFDLPEQTAVTLLWDEYNPRCVPPWDRDNPKERRDFERKVSEANKHPIKPRGWLLTDTGYNSADAALDQQGDAIARRMIAASVGGAPAPSADNGTADDFAARYGRRRTLADFPDPKPEANNPNALFQNGWLRKGGAAFFISVSGAGKSVAATQFAECFALGRPWFGITPVRPLRISVYQWEDDDEEVADFRNNIRRGLRGGGWTYGDTAKAEAVPIYHDVTGLAGNRFIQYLAYAQARDKADLVILNPFQSFSGCDISKNAELSNLLRVQLDTIINNDETPCGCIIIHHTNKVPSNAKDRNAWLDTNSAAYAGAGGAEIVNYSRALLVLRPTETHGFYDLIAAKRGARLGWKTADDTPTIVKTIAHSSGMMYWREATPEEVAAISAGKSIEDTEAKRGKVIELCRQHGKPFETKTELVNAIGAAGIGKQTRARALIDECLTSGELIEHGTGKGSGKSIGTPDQFGGFGASTKKDEEAPEFEFPWQELNNR